MPEKQTRLNKDIFGPTLEAGIVCVTKKVIVAGDGGRFEYGAKRNHEFVVLLVDFKNIIDDKKRPVKIDKENIIKRLEAIGFVGTNKIEKFLGKKKYNEFVKQVAEDKL
jgi:hypothetical protein